MKKKKRMNHKDTHPNWANLFGGECNGVELVR